MITDPTLLSFDAGPCGARAAAIADAHAIVDALTA